MKSSLIGAAGAHPHVSRDSFGFRFLINRLLGDSVARPEPRRRSGFRPTFASALLAILSACLGAQATAAIAYVQNNYSEPQSPQSTVGVTYAGAQAAGNLNVVAIGWANTTATISTVTDSRGNTYTLAIGPTAISGVASQSIYYAKNIVSAAAGVNTVTVNFNAAVPYPSVRIVEYSGINTTAPLDVTAGSTGAFASVNLLVHSRSAFVIGANAYCVLSE